MRLPDFSRVTLSRVTPVLRARRREFAIGAAALLLLPIALAGGGIIRLGGPAQNSPIVFGGATLYSGEINSIPVTVRDGTATITLPDGFFPLVRGMLHVEPTATSDDLEDGKLRFLAPPVFGNFTFTAAGRAGTSSAAYEVVKGSTPVVSGEDAVGNLEYITTAFTLRFSGSPKLAAAADHFMALFEGYGFEARKYYYPWEVVRRPVILSTFINLIVVCGFQEGTDRSSDWIVLGAHMDSVPQAIEGAYDDGSGTSALLEVAQGLSQFKTHHTIVYCLWGGEEEGLYGSNAWVDTEATSPISLYINMDMAGLSWPAPFNFTAFVGPDEEEGSPEHPMTVSVLENMTDRELRYPREGNFSLIEDPFGRSDHVSFWSVGAPTVFFFGADDVEYPDYHSRDDTVATMTRLAGGRDVLVAGFDTLVWMAVYLTLHADEGHTD